MLFKAPCWSAWGSSQAGGTHSVVLWNDAQVGLGVGTTRTDEMHWVWDYTTQN